MAFITDQFILDQAPGGSSNLDVSKLQVYIYPTYLMLGEILGDQLLANLNTKWTNQTLNDLEIELVNKLKYVQVYNLYNLAVPFLVYHLSNKGLQRQIGDNTTSSIDRYVVSTTEWVRKTIDQFKGIYMNDLLYFLNQNKTIFNPKSKLDITNESWSCPIAFFDTDLNNFSNLYSQSSTIPANWGL